MQENYTKISEFATDFETWVVTYTVNRSRYKLPGGMGNSLFFKRD